MSRANVPVLSADHLSEAKPLEVNAILLPPEIDDFRSRGKKLSTVILAPKTLVSKIFWNC